MADSQDIRWSTSYHAIQMGCRGIITKEKATARKLTTKTSTVQIEKDCKSLAEVAMKSLFSIFHALNYNVWHGPPQLKPKVYALQYSF